jgi:hypothetical protein
LTGWEVREVGVHHYPRLHGRSQFFRLQSLATTLSQLLRLYARVTFGRYGSPKAAIARQD